MHQFFLPPLAKRSKLLVMNGPIVARHYLRSVRLLKQ